MGVASTSGRAAFAPSLARRYGKLDDVALPDFYPFFLLLQLAAARRSLPSGSPPLALSEACVRLGAIERLSLLLSVDPHASTQDRGCLLPLTANWTQRSGAKSERIASEGKRKTLFFFCFPFLPSWGGVVVKERGGMSLSLSRIIACFARVAPVLPSAIATRRTSPEGDGGNPKAAHNKTKQPSASFSSLGRRRRAERAAAAAARRP